MKYFIFHFYKYHIFVVHRTLTINTLTIKHKPASFRFGRIAFTWSRKSC